MTRTKTQNDDSIPRLPDELREVINPEIRGQKAASPMRGWSLLRLKTSAAMTCIKTLSSHRRRYSLDRMAWGFIF
jgi:hypothetical protein